MINTSMRIQSGCLCQQATIRFAVKTIRFIEFILVKSRTKSKTRTFFARGFGKSRINRIFVVSLVAEEHQYIGVLFRPIFGLVCSLLYRDRCVLPIARCFHVDRDRAQITSERAYRIRAVAGLRQYNSYESMRALDGTDFDLDDSYSSTEDA